MPVRIKRYKKKQKQKYLNLCRARPLDGAFWAQRKRMGVGAEKRLPERANSRGLFLYDISDRLSFWSTVVDNCPFTGTALPETLPTSKGRARHHTQIGTGIRGRYDRCLDCFQA